MPPPAPAIPLTDFLSMAGLLSATGIALRTDDAIYGAITTVRFTATTNNGSNVLTAVSSTAGITVGDFVVGAGVAGASVLAIGVNTLTISAPATAGGAGVSFTDYSTPWSSWAIGVGTGKVNRYCQPLYDVAQLANSWSVWNWATVFGCEWLCSRRLNPLAGQLKALVDEAMDELREVRAGTMQIEDAAYRNTMQPCWVNVRLDERFSIKKLRTERTLSERTPAQYPQFLDLGDQIIGPFEINSL